VHAAFEKASGRSIPYEVVARRPGDAAVSYADPAKALADLGWSGERDIDTMCRDHWNWQRNNPEGYGS
jgi:UDP-glucose 4-epimerase